MTTDTANRFAHRLAGMPILGTCALVSRTEEEQRWAARLNRAVTGELPAFSVDDVVIDGDLRSAHYRREFVVTAVDGDFLTMTDVDWGDVQLTRVHRTFFESAGRRWVEHTCGCPRYMRASATGACTHYHCPNAH